MAQRTGLVGVSVGALLILSLAAPARGQLVDEEAVGRLTIGGSVGVLVPSMSEVNRNVSVVNPFLRRAEVRSLDRIHEGILTGLDIRYRLGRTPPEEPGETISFLQRLSIGFTWGAVSARTEINDITRVLVRFYSRATTYTPYVLYHLPFLEQSQPRLQLMVGGGLVFMRSGYVEWSVDDMTNNIFIPEGDISELAGTAQASGSGTGFMLQGGASYMLNNRFSVAVDMGYRRGKISNLSLDEAVGQNKRFPGDEDPATEDIVRRPGDWSVIDFFKRDGNAEYDGKKRTDPTDDGGCEDCPLYYTGGDLDVDYSGPFANISFRVHF